MKPQYQYWYRVYVKDGPGTKKLKILAHDAEKARQRVIQSGEYKKTEIISIELI